MIPVLYEINTQSIQIYRECRENLYIFNKKKTKKKEKESNKPYDRNIPPFALPTSKGTINEG